MMPQWCRQKRPSSNTPVPDAGRAQIGFMPLVRLRSKAFIRRIQNMQPLKDFKAFRLAPRKSHAHWSILFYR
jgi:hypothetical protein